MHEYNWKTDTLSKKTNLVLPYLDPVSGKRGVQNNSAGNGSSLMFNQTEGVPESLIFFL